MTTLMRAALNGTSSNSFAEEMEKKKVNLLSDGQCLLCLCSGLIIRRRFGLLLLFARQLQMFST